MKLNFGPISNYAGESMDICINKIIPNKPIDILIGGALIVGGVLYLTSTAYRDGANAFEDAEFKVLEALGLITYHDN